MRNSNLSLTQLLAILFIPTTQSFGYIEVSPLTPDQESARILSPSGKTSGSVATFVRGFDTFAKTYLSGHETLLVAGKKISVFRPLFNIVLLLVASHSRLNLALGEDQDAEKHFFNETAARAIFTKAAELFWKEPGLQFVILDAGFSRRDIKRIESLLGKEQLPVPSIYFISTTAQVLHLSPSEFSAEKIRDKLLFLGWIKKGPETATAKNKNSTLKTSAQGLTPPAK